MPLSSIEVQHRRPQQAEYPHVVKFSGGRSSALAALGLAENGSLDPERGDLVLFANTSAEHPATYRFADRVSAKLEDDYGLPVIWYEFCTVEDARRGKYVRKAAYRLVSRNPAETDPNGYHSRGEVFEEMLSWQQMLPNPMKRSCTYKLKLAPAHLLLEEWFSGAYGPRHRGHHHPDPYLSAAAAFTEYESNGGGQPRAEYMRRAEYVYTRPPFRAEQKWADFTNAYIINPPQPGDGMWGRPPFQHVTLLGLRADEPARVNRVLDRTFLSEGAASSGCGTQSQPGGEHPHFPLYDSGAAKQDVLDWWEAQPFDLEMSGDLGNCVFCFMKPAAQLEALANLEDPMRHPGGPSDISWWVDIERRYRRRAPRRERERERERAKPPSGSAARAGRPMLRSEPVTTASPEDGYPYPQGVGSPSPATAQIRARPDGAYLSLPENVGRVFHRQDRRAGEGPRRTGGAGTAVELPGRPQPRIRPSRGGIHRR